jgi:hypothetical protein
VPRLGEILVEQGVLSAEGLRSGLEACRHQGGRLGTWLMRLGLVNEAQLLGALAKQSGCPSAHTLELATAAPEVRALIPDAFARQHLVVAFSRRGRTLDVATLSPNDLVLLDEISSLTGLVVRPYVATEAALTAALAITPKEGASAAPAPGTPRSHHREWQQFWRGGGTLRELLQALDQAPSGSVSASSATFPGLTPLEAPPVHLGDARIEHLGEALAAVQHREQVASVLLQFFAPLARRVVLFALHQGKVMAWAATGEGIVDEDFHTLMLPMDRPSVFLNLAAGAELHCGPVGAGEGNRLLLEALGTPAPSAAVIVPLAVRERPVGFLWLDNGNEGATGIPLSLVKAAAQLVNLTLEALVLRQKIRSIPRLTQGVGAD